MLAAIGLVEEAFRRGREEESEEESEGGGGVRGGSVGLTWKEACETGIRGPQLLLLNYML